MKVEPAFLSSGEKIRGVYCRCSPLKISAEPIVVVILDIELKHRCMHADIMRLLVASITSSGTRVKRKKTARWTIGCGSDLQLSSR